MKPERNIRRFDAQPGRPAELPRARLSVPAHDLSVGFLETFRSLGGRRGLRVVEGLLISSTATR